MEFDPSPLVFAQTLNGRAVEVVRAGIRIQAHFLDELEPIPHHKPDVAVLVRRSVTHLLGHKTQCSRIFDTQPHAGDDCHRGNAEQKSTNDTKHHRSSGMGFFFESRHSSKVTYNLSNGMLDLLLNLSSLGLG